MARFARTFRRECRQPVIRSTEASTATFWGENDELVPGLRSTEQRNAVDNLRGPAHRRAARRTRVLPYQGPLGGDPRAAGRPGGRGLRLRDARGNGREGALLGALFGLLPIGWIVLNVIFIYQLTDDTGQFEVLQKSITGITNDRRLQLLLIAFCFGAFFEGAAGFGTPVAVTAAMLIGLGFKPLAAAGLSLIANTAPVAFGALGTPIIALAAGDRPRPAGSSPRMVGRQLPVLLADRAVLADLGDRRLSRACSRSGRPSWWPASSFAIPQFLVSNFHGPWLVDIVAAIVSMGASDAVPEVLAAEADLAVDSREEHDGSYAEAQDQRVASGYTPAQVFTAWTPWLILTVLVFVWGLPPVKDMLNDLSHRQVSDRRPATIWS